MKALISVGSLDIGGVELRTLETIQYLRSMHKGYSVYIYVTSGRNGVLDERYKSAGAYIVYGCRGWKTVVEYYKTIKRIRPQVVHINASYASGIFSCVAFLCRVPRRIAHIRSMSFPEMSAVYKLKYLIYIPLLNIFSTHVVGVNSYSRRTARTRRGKWTTLYDGIPEPKYNDKGRELYKPSRPFRILMVGRFHECKNIPFALKVISDIKRDRSVQIFLIGKEDPAIRSELDALIHEHELTDSVIFMGEIPSQAVYENMADSDLLMVTSTREGLPGTVLEASAIGVPVLSSDLPGVKEIQEYIPSVKTLSLRDGLSIWSGAAINQAEVWNPRRNQVRDYFRGSPFTLESHVAHLKKLWGFQ